jgi:cell wall-associated NlpC family hydrolase
MKRRNIVFFMMSSLLVGCTSWREPSTPVDSSIAPSPGPLPDPGISDEDAMRVELVMLALSLIGTPYRWGGRSPAAGFDCSGLVAYVYERSLQMTLPPTAAAQSRVGRAVSPNELQSGDLVFFNTRRRPNSHVGLYVAERHFVHAPTEKDTVRIENFHVPYWLQHFDGARSLIA